MTLLVSVPLALEYEAVCFRPEHQIASGLTRREIAIFVDAVIAMAEPVEAYFLWRPQLRDPGDEMVLETAVSGRADAIVTFDIADFGAAPRRFGLEILLPKDALRRLK